MKPLITIITVVYNGDAHIEQTIKSIIGQTYKNVEYIIIDGGSNDETVNIINKYKKSISKFISEPDKGIYDAINKGLSFATGELIGIINADDWYENNAIEIIANYYAKYQDVGVFHGVLRYIKGERTYQIIGRSSDFLKEDMIPHPTCFVKRELYDKYGIFDVNFKIAGDYEFMLRMKRYDVKFFFIESIIANFRMNGISSNSFETIKEKLEIQKRYNLINNFVFLLKKLQNYLFFLCKKIK